jgi:soluble lytic murein transglycosylase-like protein
VSGPQLAQGSLKRLITNAATRHHIDPDFVTSVVKAESGFNPRAVSPKGARGLMQLMPQTASRLGVDNVLDPAANVEGGTKYLRQLLDQYDGDAVKALAAYNAGPQRVAQYGGVPPYPETRAYVARIVDDYNRKKIQQQAHSAAAPADK